MGVLILGDEENTNIQMAIQKAKERPLPWAIAKTFAMMDPAATKLKLEDVTGRGNAVREEYPPQKVLLGTYRAAFSYEEQPKGIVRHLSVSSSTAGRGDIPSTVAMDMISKSFGFSAFPPAGGRVWIEEFGQDQWAVNVVELEE